MPFDNLPGIWKDEQDGNLMITPVNDNPIVLVLGTAAQGNSETLTTVTRVSDAAKSFGKEGTLTRGLYETSIAGAKNIVLYRIGATSAKLSSIGTGGGGYTIETIAKDDSAGTDYTLFFEASTGRVRVYRASDDELVYDNNPSYPLQAIDLGEVTVSGSSTGGSNIGSLGTPVTLAAASGLGGGTAVYTAGTDGTDLSRMETYEALYNAYDLLGDQQADVVVPMNVYLDDLNVMDMTVATVSGLLLTGMGNAYPDASASDDVLGKLYVQEYQGENLFWWYFPTNSVTPSFASDGGADIFPVSKGSASALLNADGDALTADDFHEVNFAYQLADFCYRQSRDNTEMNGVIGVLPPTSFGLKDVSTWVGTLPTTTVDANGDTIVSTNGTGLLGNKLMAGRIAAGGLSAHTVGGVAGLYNGGLIATEDSWMDGLQIEDDNEHLIDIGKYISVVAAYPILSNPSQSTSYTATGAPTYGGFYSGLSPVSAPTNKQLRSLRLPFRVSLAKLDLLAGKRYVTFHAKTRGIVVSDAPTAARPDSDYQRLTTVRQVKAAVDAIRAVGEPFLGEGMSGATLAALETAIDGQLKSLVKQGLLVRYDFQLSSTAQQRVLGQATLQLKLVPAFELRQITIVVALAAV